MILEALSPIFAIILLGFLVSRTPISNPTVWEGLERLTYYVFFPALLVDRLSNTRIQVEELLDIGYALSLALFVFYYSVHGPSKVYCSGPGFPKFCLSGWHSIQYLYWFGLHRSLIWKQWTRVSSFVSRDICPIGQCSKCHLN